MRCLENYNFCCLHDVFLILNLFSSFLSSRLLYKIYYDSANHQRTLCWPETLQKQSGFYIYLFRKHADLFLWKMTIFFT
jgi:hypothetical protein